MNVFRKPAPALLACAVAALAAWSAPALSGADLRAAMTDRARKEVLSLSKGELPSGELGEWKDIIDSILFCIFRRTELYRGPLRVLVARNDAIVSRLYADGTFVLSTGLLDAIDADIFRAAGESARRLRDFAAERESRLAPFIAPEAARFALDGAASSFARNPAGYPLPSRPEVLDADLLSPVLLDLAGYDGASYAAWLGSLRDIYRNPSAWPAFVPYLSALPAPDDRLAALDSSAEELADIEAEFGETLSALRGGVGLEDADQALAALGERFPASTWVSRLASLVRHSFWLSSVPAGVQRVKTILPFAAEADPSREAFVALLGKKTALSGEPAGSPASAPAAAPASAAAAEAIPGDARAYIAAVESYKKTLASYNDPALASAYALLLYASGNPGVRELALKTADEAARAEAEAGSTSVTARANGALLLYLSGTGTARALFTLETLRTSRAETADRDPVLLDEGWPEDRRDLALNLALILGETGDRAGAAELEAELYTTVAGAGDGRLAFRNARPGISADDLVARWGRPSEIVYTWHLENWVFDSLRASVLVSADGSGTRRVTLIRVGPRSPVSLPSDIRPEDRLSDLEAALGPADYRAGDSSVYLEDGLRISVFALSGRIRSFTAGF